MSATGRTDAARGLTLVELVVVVAILAVLALPLALRLGAGGLWGGQPTLPAVAAQLVAAVEAARDRALLARRSVRLEPRTDGWVLGGAPTRLAGATLDWAPAPAPLLLRADRSGTPFSVRLQVGAARGRCSFDGWGAVTCDLRG